MLLESPYFYILLCFNKGMYLCLINVHLHKTYFKTCKPILYSNNLISFYNLEQEFKKYIAKNYIGTVCLIYSYKKYSILYFKSKLLNILSVFDSINTLFYGEGTLVTAHVGVHKPWVNGVDHYSWTRVWIELTLLYSCKGTYSHFGYTISTFTPAQLFVLPYCCCSETKI